MKAKKQKKTGHAQLEKLLTFAGLALIIIGCLANLYGTSYNLRFIHDPIDVIYYLRYLLLLSGGFSIGYLFTHKSADHKGHGELFGGVFYSVLAITLYWVFDLLRIGIQNVSFPWAKILFEGAPLFSIVAVLLVAYISRRTLNHFAVSNFAKIMLIAGFGIYQVFILSSSIMAVQTSTAPAWVVIAGYLVTPLVVALISFLLLKNLKMLLERLFYAVFIGALFSTLSVVLWELRTDPSYGATNTFSIIVILLSLVFAVTLIWRAYKIIK